MKKWSTTLDRWFGFTGLPEEERKRRRLSVELILFTCGGGLANYSAAWLLGIGHLQSMTILYIALALTNVLLLRVFKRYSPYRYIALGLLFLFSFLGHTGMGGYVNSSAVVTSGLLAVMGALIFSTVRVARTLLVLLVLGFAGLAGYDWARPEEPVDRGIVLVYFASNLSFISVMAYLALESFLLKTQQLRAELSTAKDRIEGLMLNMIPERTAAELMQTGHVQARSHDSASVLFTDFIGFSAIAAAIPPEKLVKELDHYFQAFDEITERHGLEKIKTIGDSYMCVGGVPDTNASHATDAVRAGLEICEFVERSKEASRLRCGFAFPIRVGIHSGPVVAGVVGTKKYAFDIWGDTVNLAARMQQGGDAGRVNISHRTRIAIGDAFQVEPRGRIVAKNLGGVEMYFVKGTAH